MKNYYAKSARPRLRRFCAATCVVCLISSGAAVGEEPLMGTRLSDGASLAVDKLAPGAQAVLNQQSGNYMLSGRTLALENFSGAIGYSSETAYILGLSGKANFDGTRVKPGQVLMMTAFDGPLSRARFDAKRYAAQWDEAAQSSLPGAYDSLMRIASRQARGKFFGYYQGTDFNIAAPVNASRELARRSVLGADVVQDVRFSGMSDSVDIERAVVSNFLNALNERDVISIAALMDPAPYGSDLRGGADGARELMAKRLINQIAALGTPNEATLVQISDNLWTVEVGGRLLEVALRPTPDFSFIRSTRFGSAS